MASEDTDHIKHQLSMIKEKFSPISCPRFTVTNQLLFFATPEFGKITSSF